MGDVGHHRFAGPALLVAGVLCGCGVVWAAARLTPPPMAGATGRGLLVAVPVLGAVVVTGLAWWLARRAGPDRAAPVLVGGVAVVLAGASTFALRGTAWGLGGLSADASFRTEAATRYASAARLADYAYRDTPAYYPPALSWLQGRTAAVLDVPAWTVLQPFQILLAAVVPLVAYWLWRRLLPALPAAAVVAATSALSADLVKPDEWLVLMCAVPWWIDLVRGARGDGVRRWPWWGHGIFAGLVLLVHTYYLLPLALATLLGWAVDLLRRRPLELRPTRALGVVLVALVVAAPYWWPVVTARASGAPSDDLQLRYTYPGANVPPLPLPVDVAGALGLVGLLWLLRAAWWARRGRSDPLAGAVSLVLVAAWLTMLGGAVGVRLGIGLLTFKTDELVVLAMAVSGVLGLLAAGRTLLDRRRTAATAVAVVATAAVVAGTVSDYVGHWVVGASVRAAQTTPYPDGTRPEGGGDLVPTDQPAFVAPGDPSVEQVRAAWKGLVGQPLDERTVLVTTRVDLIATTPVHLFTTWKSIYSNPLGEFEARLDVLRQVAACADSRCAHALLADNPYDRVDGLVLARDGAQLVMPILVDDFPDRSLTTQVAFPLRVLQGPGFTTCRLGSVTLVAVTTGPGSRSGAPPRVPAGAGPGMPCDGGPLGRA